MFEGYRGPEAYAILERAHQRDARPGHGKPHGEDHGHSKLTEERAWQATLWHFRDHLTYEVIGQRLDLHSTTISQLCNGRTWKHLELPGRDYAVE